MIEEECIENDEVEVGSFYNTICGDSNDDNSNEEVGVDGGNDKSPAS
jgi:hypothetical protein